MAPRVQQKGGRKAAPSQTQQSDAVADDAKKEMLEILRMFKRNNTDIECVPKSQVPQGPHSNSHSVQDMPSSSNKENMGETASKKRKMAKSSKSRRVVDDDDDDEDELYPNKFKRILRSSNKENNGGTPSQTATGSRFSRSSRWQPNRNGREVRSEHQVELQLISNDDSDDDGIRFDIADVFQNIKFFTKKEKLGRARPTSNGPTTGQLIRDFLMKGDLSELELEPHVVNEPCSDTPERNFNTIAESFPSSSSSPIIVEFVSDCVKVEPVDPEELSDEPQEIHEPYTGTPERNVDAPSESALPIQQMPTEGSEEEGADFPPIVHSIWGHL